MRLNNSSFNLNISFHDTFLVILRDLEEARIPKRPIASSTVGFANMPFHLPPCRKTK